MKKILNKKRWIVILGFLSIGLLATVYLAIGTQLFAQEEAETAEELSAEDETIEVFDTIEEATDKPDSIEDTVLNGRDDFNTVINVDQFLDYFGLSGNAVFNAQTGIITLTEARNNQTGSFFLKDQININFPFILKGQVYLGVNQNSADGVGFGFHTGSPGSIGQAGSGFGMFGLQDVFGFKLDTYYNGTQAAGNFIRPDPISTGAFGSLINVDNGWFTSYTGSDAPARSITRPNNTWRDITISYFSDGNFRVEFEGMIWEKNMVTSSWIVPGKPLSFLVSGSTGLVNALQQFQFQSFSYVAQTHSLDLEASPVDGGKPSSGSNSLNQGDKTDLSANPNPGYAFSHWEIVSGAGASINNLTSPTATFTMGDQDTVVRAVYEENEPGEVYVHHVDREGHELADMETLSGVIGDAYTTEPKEIEGYTLVETPANANGVFTNEMISVTYVYDADPTEAVLTIEFINEADQVLSDYTMTLDRMIGDQIDLEEEPEVLAQIETVLNAGYEIIERPETPVYLEEPQITIHYRVQGVLRLTSAPEVIDFGSLTYNAQTQRVEDPEFDEDLVVADTRAGTTSGWTMTASLSSPLVNEDGNELINALRYVSEGQERILSQFDQPIYTNTSGSAGVFNISDMWGTDSQTDGLKLQIDGRDNVFTGRYTGVITWKVMAGQP